MRTVAYGLLIFLVGIALGIGIAKERQRYSPIVPNDHLMEFCKRWLNQ